MATQKKDREYTDAKGNLHKVFANGRTEIYIGGFDKDASYVECTDAADESVNRKRFLRQRLLKTVEESLIVRDDPEVATPGQDFDYVEIDDDFEGLDDDD